MTPAGVVPPPAHAVLAASAPRFVFTPVGAALLSWLVTLTGSAVALRILKYSDGGTFVFLQACALFFAWFFAHCTLVSTLPRKPK